MNRLSTAALALVLGLAGRASANEKSVAFGALERPDAATVQARVGAWLKEAGKSDPATLQRFDAIWKQADRSVCERVADALALGSPAAAKLLVEARDPRAPAPIEVSPFFKDAKVPAFVRANIALAYARALANKRVHEEGLAVLKLFNPEQVVDPAAFLFYRAVSEHALLLKPEASKTIFRLQDEAQAIAPERYKTVATLMLLDMQTWKDKDLASIARKMENIERRLELSRGGPVTQKMQKEVVARLDEMIKKLENQAKANGSKQNGGNCPGGGPPQGGPPNGNNPSAPATESGIANGGGTGHVDPIKIRKLAEEWGRLPPRERTRNLQEMTQGMSPRHREAIENYFRNLAQAQQR
jgi:hypothetical protein